jgi:ElaB/YqjD/DUF883 family membrane-anchored ribosome-binding protein
MAIWGRSRPNELQDRIDDIQAGLVALGELLGGGASTAARAAKTGVTETASDLSSALMPVASDLKTQLEGLASLVAAFTGGLAKKAGTGGKQAYDVVEEKVEDNAMLAVLAAAAVGVLVGAYFLGGSSKPQPAPQQRRSAAPTRSTNGRRKRA